MVDESAKPAASVVIPAYKSRDTIHACLESLSSQETGLPYEVIVVESSGDGSDRLIRERFPQVQLIESHSRLLSGAARNLGAESASGGLLLFTDSDCVAEPKWIEKMWSAHRESDAAAVAGAVRNGNPENPISVAGYITEFSEFFPFGPARLANYLPSGNLSYKAEVFRRYGGFDPDEPLYVDLMFNKRLFAAGEKLLFRPDIEVAHRHRAVLRDYLSHEIARGRAAVTARRRGLLVGRSWVRHPVAACLVIPALFARKASVYPYRFARAYPSELPGLARALPYIWAGLACWHYGFLKEVLQSAGRRRTA